MKIGAFYRAPLQIKDTTSTFVNGGRVPEKIDFEFLKKKTQKTGKIYVLATVYSYPDTLRC